MASPGDDGTGGGCPVWGCGSNTSKMDGIPFIDAHEGGEPNAEGFWIVRFEKKDANNTWLPYRADVLNAELVARDLATNDIVFRQSEVTGARFVMRNNRRGSYYLYVTATNRMQYWAQPIPSDPRSTFTYRLKWTPALASPTAPLTDICGANPDGPSRMADFYAVLFDGDRFDIDAIKVTADQRSWFNIGCAGHALAKQHLLAHTTSGARAFNKTVTLAQRTANLKMITADYCGGGHPFTVPGQPLLWKDENNWYNSVAPGYTIEARWNENGATCLDIPRVDYSVEGSPIFPNGVEPLLDPQWGWCASRPPPCTGTTADFQGAHLISANVQSAPI